MRQVNTKHYADQIAAARYPDLSPEDVQEVCLYVMRQLYVAIAVKRYDVAIKDSGRDLKLKFYKRDHNIERANKAAKRKALVLRKIRQERATSVAVKKHFK